VAAAELFPPEDLSAEMRQDSHSVAFFAAALREGRLWVARSVAQRDVAGFAVVVRLERSVHLEEVDVHPAHQRRGLGRALVLHVAAEAWREGAAALTLTTFRHLPWNAPFYRGLGFRELSAAQLDPDLERILRAEAEEGLDPEKRVAMKLDL
jgi:GNAT superfamily N-acetyltransferase